MATFPSYSFSLTPPIANWQPPLGRPAPLVQAIAAQTRLQPNGMVQFPMGLIEQAVQHGRALVPALQQQLTASLPAAQRGDIMPALATIYTAERLAEAGTPVDNLYPTISQLDRHPHPLIAIYLAGVYSKMARPEPFGWALMKLMETAQTPPPATQPHSWKLHEELGKVVMKQLQQRPSLWQQLQPYLNNGYSPQISTSPPVSPVSVR